MDASHKLRGILVLTFMSTLSVAAPVNEYSMERLTGDDMRYRPMQRNVLKSAAKWPNGEVPYMFASSLPAARIKVIQEAIAAYNQYTCIRFVPKKSTHSDYIRFMDGGEGSCYSYIGKQGGSQDLSIGDGCHYQLGIVLHEMAHALGFLHEHNRPDRDDYVKVRFDRIDGWKQSNFDKNANKDVELYALRYDYLSMMHYGRSYFSMGGGDTIVTVDTTYQTQIGQRKNFSICDLEKINRHYGCTKYCIPSNPCDKSKPQPPLPKSSPATTPATTRITTKSTPKPCSDDPAFALCKYVKSDPSLCDQLPGAFLLKCKKSCNNCNNSKCFDSKVASYAKVCQKKQYFTQFSCKEGNGPGNALLVFCPLTCGACKK